MLPDLPLNNEDELRQHLAKGNEQAFSRIVHHYYPRLLSFTIKITKTKHVAEEIIQETFLRLWQKRQDMAQVEQLGPWLFRVTANLSLTWLKRAAMEGHIIQQLKPQDNNPTEEWLNLRQSTEQLNAAVAKLPEQQKKIFRLSKEEGLSNQEIADKLQLSVSTVKNHLTRALQTLRENLGNTNLLILCICLIQQATA